MGGNVRVRALSLTNAPAPTYRHTVGCLFISASIPPTQLFQFIPHTSTLQQHYMMINDTKAPTKVLMMGIFMRRMPPLELLVSACPWLAPQNPEPFRTLSGTRITGVPPFVYSTSTVPLLPTAHCLQEKILEMASESFQQLHVRLTRYSRSYWARVYTRTCSYFGAVKVTP